MKNSNYPYTLSFTITDTVIRQNIPPIPTLLHNIADCLSVVSACLSVSRLSYLCTLLKPFDGFRCHMARTLVSFNNTAVSQNSGSEFDPAAQERLTIKALTNATNDKETIFYIKEEDPRSVPSTSAITCLPAMPQHTSQAQSRALDLKTRSMPRRATPL